MKWLALLLALVCATPSVAQSNIIGDGTGGVFGDVKVSGGSCVPGTAATNFLARTSGLSGTETTMYCNLINGMVADGDWVHLDFFYVLSTKNTATAAFNLTSTSFSLITHGTCTFTADGGYTGDASTCFFDTQFNPNTAGGNQSRNSVTAGGCQTNSRTTGEGWTTIGAGDGTNTVGYIPKYTDGNFYENLNSTNNNSAANANAQGSWIIQRTGANLTAVFMNGTSFFTGTESSTGITNANYYILADSFGSGSNLSGDTVALIFSGDGAISAANISARIHTAMETLGINVC
jgi:hypothetical protein